MVNFKDLKAPTERIVREVVKAPFGDVLVFEPRIDEFDTILEIQREDGVRNGQVVNFDGNTVIRKLFPLLTDLDMSDLTDEDIEEVVNNPSIYLLTIQNIISQIVAEVNSMFMQRIKAEITQASTLVDQATIIKQIPNIIGKEAKRVGDEETAKNVEKIISFEDKVKESEEAKG